MAGRQGPGFSEVLDQCMKEQPSSADPLRSIDATELATRFLKELQGAQLENIFFATYDTEFCQIVFPVTHAFLTTFFIRILALPAGAAFPLGGARLASLNGYISRAPIYPPPVDVDIFVSMLARCLPDALDAKRRLAFGLLTQDWSWPV